jgi:heme/copper-type cytochrome/quinol oxidase subunit 1
MTWSRLPIFVWAIFATAILMGLASPMLLAASLMALLDRTVGTVNFLAPMGGSPFLWENLFWFFGHPEVYILPLFAAGILGMPRRVSTYNPALHGINVWVSIAAFCLAGSMVIFIVNFVLSQLLDREPAKANPRDSRGLEWQLPTPVPAHNFDEIPVVRSAPYEYGVPDAPPVADLYPSRAGAEGKEATT